MKSGRKQAFAFLSFLFVAALGFLPLLISYLERRFTFLKVKASGITPEKWGIAYEDMGRYCATESSGRIRVWYIPFPDAERVILIFHGRGYAIDALYGTAERAEQLSFLQKELRAALFLVECRGYGESYGKVSFSVVFNDAQAAVRMLQEHKGFSPDRMILVGHSLGSAVAVRLASQDNFALVVLVAALANFRKVALYHTSGLIRAIYSLGSSVPWAPAAPYEPLSDIAKVKCPIIIVHGTRDHLIPFKFAAQLYQLANHPKYLIPLYGEDHLDFFHVMRALPVMKKILDKEI